MKKSKYLILTLLIPLFIIAFYILVFKDFNFHNNIIVNDLSTQYSGLLSYLKNALLGNDSLFYSFSKGIGGNMIGTVTYYLISPFNILLLFFKNMNIAVALGMILRFCFCDLTMFLYLKNKYKKYDISTVLFSTIYAFSGYMINYYFNIMWIDVVILLPLVLKYLDDIIEGKKNIKFILFLALTLILNYYLGYMVFIFVVIYTIYELLSKYSFKNDKKIIFKNLKYIAIYMILALLVSSIILLPTALDMINNILRYNSSSNFLNFNFENVLMVFSRFLINYWDLGTRFSPQQINIYITLFGFLLLIKYFLNKNFTKKEKILTFSMIILLLLSTVFDALNLFWHGFSYPNGYNFRFSFCFVLFFINIAYKQFLNNQKLDIKPLLIITISFIISCLLLINKYYYLPVYLIIINIIFFITYIILLNKDNLKWFLILLVFIEIIVNFNLMFITNKKISFNNIFHTFKDELCGYYQEVSSNDRISIQPFMTYNEGLNCNVYDNMLSVSSNNNKYYNFMTNVGYTVTYSTILKNMAEGPFIDSIFGMKNIMLISRNDDLGYEFVDFKKIEYDKKEKPIYIYNQINNNALSLGYVINNDTIAYTTNPFENQNELAKKMSGLNINIFDKVEVTKLDKNEYEFETDKKYYYFYNYYPIPINYTKYMLVHFKNEALYDMYAFEKGIVRYENNNFPKHYISLDKINKYYKEYINPLIYTLNEENYQIVMDKLKEKQLQNIKIDGNKFSGTINLENNEKVMLSIINEKGWHVKVNNKKVDYGSAYDTFITLDLEKGINNIEMYFIPPGLIEGSIISMIGLITSILISIKRRKYE